jgi:hypothetical protein
MMTASVVCSLISGDTPWQSEVMMSDKDKDDHTTERREGGVIKNHVLPDDVTPARAADTNRVPPGDRVTIDPTLADEEVVSPNAEGAAAKQRTSVGNDPERAGTN